MGNENIPNRNNWRFGDYSKFMLEDKVYDTRRLMSSISFITPYRRGTGTINFNSRDTDQLTGNSEKNNVIIGSNVEYASSVNFGTSKQRARHFMETGIYRALPRMKEVAEIALKGGEKL